MPDLSRWDTGISDVADSRIAYRGQPIGDLIAQGDLSSTIWLVLFGTVPDVGSTDALRRAMIAAFDHSVAAPSALVARATASTRSSVPFAVAAGMIAFAGPAHGGAAEGAAYLLVEADLEAKERGWSAEEAATWMVTRVIREGRRMPGYGHPYHQKDPRVGPLMGGIAESHRYRDIAAAAEEQLEKAAGRRLAMNADSAVAALLLDAGLGPADVTLVTALGRAFGLAAHAREEQSEERPFRAPASESVHYRGPRTQPDDEEKERVL